ncbi:Beta-hexosaminidase [Acidisarcina polymorpha]|uniref:Beta-hexosaminidase n=1 Tax=Acidisarcina polymorpha TaxID=2211140 RepID=A0A2Z5G8Z2_9BACT|nr:beta-N-acetylhexosaminidase [Acidisarcina polymorpha]AXC15267.1 Beta-hexosaminidase [Acidisarcina polymorpha]
MKHFSLLASTALALMLTSHLAIAATELPALMPLPSTISQGDGSFPLTASFTVAYATPPDERLTAAVNRTLTRMQYSSGVALAHAAVVPSAGSLTISVSGPDAAVQGVDDDESYHLAVTAQGIQLASTTVVGALHGLETLLQLATFRDGHAIIPAVTIDDQPRFRWRGLMIDVARHFEPVEVIKRNLDAMALVKLNVFHWHLSDDQGFRAESKRFPKLTAEGSHGEFYTQEEMREVVAYAHARGIRVVPEFDMPGHTLSWQVAYPDIGSTSGPFSLPDRFGIHDEALDPTRESTYKFLDALVGEMAAIFPDAYFHIGGDESNGNAWRSNPKIVAFMKSHDIKDTDALQVYFNSKLLKIVAKHGKHMIGWDEVFTPGLPKDIVIESWRGQESLSKAAAQGYQGILAAPYYLDGMATAEKHFLADPVPADTQLTPEQQKSVLGGEVAMWAEQINPQTIDSRIWPRAAAIAERFWSPQSDRDVESMYTRLWPVSLQLETVGLTHISGPQKMLRNLAQSQQPADLDTLASVLEPVSFHERYQGQHTDARTPLDRLVDAVVPDPPSRFEMSRSVNEALADGAAAGSAREVLRQRFQSWVDAAATLNTLISLSPRMADAAPRVQQLAQLGQTGLQALKALPGKTAPAGWREQQTQIINEAAKSVALTRFTFLLSLQKLVDAAGGAIQ